MSEEGTVEIDHADGGIGARGRALDDGVAVRAEVGGLVDAADGEKTG